VKESPQPAKLGRGLHHETHSAEQLIAQGKIVADACRMIEVL
jgi:hypothetical protein